MQFVILCDKNNKTIRQQLYILTSY